MNVNIMLSTDVNNSTNTLPSFGHGRFWRGMYNRFENGIHPRENIMDILATTVDHTLSMMEHIEQLEMVINADCIECADSLF